MACTSCRWPGTPDPTEPQLVEVTGSTTGVLRPNRWAGVTICSWTIVSTMSSVYLTAALLDPIRRSLGGGRTGYGLIVAAFFLSSAAAAPLARRVAERVDPFSVTAAAAAATTAAILLVASAGSSVEIALALVVAGIANSLVQPAGGRLARRSPRLAELNLASGLFAAANIGGALVAGALVALTPARVGWRSTLLVGAALPALMSLAGLTGRILRAPAQIATRIPVASTSALRPGHAPQHAVVWWAVAATCAGVGVNTVATFFVSIARDSGLSTRTAGVMLTAASAVAVVIRIAVGLGTTRINGAQAGVTWSIRIAATMMISGALGLSIMSFGSATPFVIGSVLAVAGGWGWVGLLLAAGLRTDAARPARAAATLQTGMFLGGGTAPLIFAPLSAALGPTDVLLLGAGAAALGAACTLLGGRAATQTIGARDPFAGL